MRVIAGKHRSRPLISPKNSDVRPTTDMIKESIFNIIQNDVIDCDFLDLFAGSGAIGIEAISRGANKVVFCDNSKESIKLIKQNLAMLKEEAEILFGDYEYALTRLKNRQFDIIFLDPPYASGLEQEILATLASSGLLKEDGRIIVEASKHTDFSYAAQLGLAITKEKIYKTNKHLFFAKEG